MYRRKLALLLGLVVLLGLIRPIAGSANHVSIQAAVGALLAERSSDTSWTVDVSWGIDCKGAQGSASYQGNLYLVDAGNGERTYLGGVSSATGHAKQLVERRVFDHYVKPELTASCFEDASLHGAGPVTVAGPPVLIPGRHSDGEGGTGGGGSGGGGGGDGDGTGGDPSAPLESDGCVNVVWGTAGPDDLAGGTGGDVIFGLQGDDRLRGEAGHDCLIGGSDDDRLHGGRGSDRLTGGARNDKLYGERGNDRLAGEDGKDTLSGGSGRDKLYGGRGRDKLSGGSGKNSYDAGAGNDYVNAVNGRRELVRCGSGKDRARVDKDDRVKSCERVKRVS